MHDSNMCRFIAHINKIQTQTDRHAGCFVSIRSKLDERTTRIVCAGGKIQCIIV